MDHVHRLAELWNDWPVRGAHGVGVVDADDSREAENDILIAATGTTIAAWWGAGVATLLLVWDVVKWKRSGPRIRWTVCMNVQFTDYNAKAAEGNWIAMEASNIGDRPTTLQNVYLFHYSNWWDRIRKKRKTAYFLARPQYTHRPPHKLSPGESWTCRFKENSQLLDLAAKGHLMFCLQHSGARRPVVSRALPTNDSNE